MSKKSLEQWLMREFPLQFKMENSDLYFLNTLVTIQNYSLFKKEIVVDRECLYVGFIRKQKKEILNFFAAKHIEIRLLQKIKNFDPTSFLMEGLYESFRQLYACGTVMDFFIKCQCLSKNTFYISVQIGNEHISMEGTELEILEGVSVFLIKEFKKIRMELLFRKKENIFLGYVFFPYLRSDWSFISVLNGNIHFEDEQLEKDFLQHFSQEQNEYLPCFDIGKELDCIYEHILKVDRKKVKHLKNESFNELDEWKQWG